MTLLQILIIYLKTQRTLGNYLIPLCKLGKGYGKWAAHPHPTYLGVPPALSGKERNLAMFSSGT